MRAFGPVLPEKQTKFAAVMQLDYGGAFATVKVTFGASVREPWKDSGE